MKGEGGIGIRNQVFLVDKALFRVPGRLKNNNLLAQAGKKPGFLEVWTLDKLSGWSETRFFKAL